jgi:membrane protease YdiL (CAAX protease family)
MIQQNTKALTGILLTLFITAAIVLFTAPIAFWITGFSKVNAGIFFVSRLLIWGSLGFVFYYTRFIEQQPLLLWKESENNILFYFLSVLAVLGVVYFGSGIIGGILFTITHSKGSIKLFEMVEFFKHNIPFLLFTAATAGVVEELIFRGYLQPRLEIVFKNSWAAIIVSALLFGLLHITYGTLSNVVIPIFIGLVFAWYYKKYRNIKVLIVCHFLIDTISLFILIKTH